MLFVGARCWWANRNLSSGDLLWSAEGGSLLVRLTGAPSRGISMCLVLTLISLALSPAYLQPSGLPQLSHVVMGVAITFHLLSRKWLWERWWTWAALFVTYTAVVNLSVYAVHNSKATLMASLYYTFNFLFWMHLLVLAVKAGTARFLAGVEKCLWIVLVLELCLVVAQHWHAYRGRAIGTFNDPNQMAHWFVCVSVMLGAIGWALHRTWVRGVIAWVIATAGVAFSTSRSGALGLAVLLFVYGLLGVRKSGVLMLTKFGFRIKIGVLFLSLILIITSLTAFAITGMDNMKDCGARLADIFVRWFGRFQDRSRNTSLEGRGYDRLWKYPEYLLFGAGEGAHYRWQERAQFLGEIHSTVAGVMFCYGVPGSIFLGCFLCKLWVALGSIWLRLLLLAPLAYSIGTYNLRNWFFWATLAIVYIAGRHMSAEGHSVASSCRLSDR